MVVLRFGRWRRRPCSLAAALALCAWAVLPLAAATRQDPVNGWQQRLDRAESALRRMPDGDTAARAQIAGELSRLNAEIASWLADFPPARESSEPWFAAGEVSGGDEALAADIGRLRALLLRIRAALEGGDGGAFYLGRVDVTVEATATASTTAEITPAGATVIGSEDLRAYDRTALAGALALAPGVSFSRVGSRNDTGVYVRGFDMRQVPLFIDGIPVYTPYDGYTDLDRFTTFDVAEVRVSKGFASVLYGPNALGGAINVVSRRPSARLEGLAGAGYGSRDSANVSANVGSRFSRWYLHGSGSYTGADTFPLAAAFVPVKAQPAGDRLNAVRRDGKFSAKVGWTPNGADEYAVSYAGQRGEKGNPPYAGSDPLVKIRYWQWPYWDKDSLYFVSNTRLGGLGYLRGRVFHDTYGNALYSYDDASYTTQAKPSSFRSLYADNTTGGSLEWGTTMGRHTVRAAGHLKIDRHEDHNTGEPPKEFDGRVVSVGVEDSVTLSPRISLVAGISGDWQETTRALDYQKGQPIDLLAACQSSGESCGSATGVNPQAGLFVGVPSGLLRLTLARKTRLPSLKDRYSYKFGTAVPNPDLEAEHNLTLEAGYQGALGRRTSFQASAFYSRIDNLIQRVYLQPNLSQQRNTGEASHAGFELDARTRLAAGIEVSGNYSFLRRENLSDPTLPLVDTPRHKGALTANAGQWHGLRAVAILELEAGRRCQNEAGTYLDVPSLATLNVKGVWTVRRAVDLEAGAFNVFDRHYWVMDGYPEPGRMFLVTLRWRF